MKKISINYISRKIFLLLISFVLLLSSHQNIFANTLYENNDIFFYNGTYSGSVASACGGTGGGGPVSIGANLDYKGKQVFTSAEIEAIKKNQSTYQKAADTVGIPWQLIAVLHKRETNLRLVNPGNGQGLYQDYARFAGPYPSGPISEAEFLRQSTWVAGFLLEKAGSQKENFKKGDPSAIQYAFFAYNGTAAAYKNQALRLGFTQQEANNGGGSPYVMNIADAKRDPATNPSGWGQIKTDGGSISFPANTDHGAFVQFMALGGASGAGSLGGGACAQSVAANGPLRDKIVQAAQAELSLWQSGQLKPGLAGYTKYTNGRSENWCADFTSYILKTAGKPISSGDGTWPGVIRWVTDSEKDLGFKVHTRSSGYSPRPGDMVVYGNSRHIAVVVSYENGNLVTIGGNQGGQDVNGYHNSSKVTMNTAKGGFDVGSLTVSHFISVTGD